VPDRSFTYQPPSSIQDANLVSFPTPIDSDKPLVFAFKRISLYRARPSQGSLPPLYWRSSAQTPHWISCHGLLIAEVLILRRRCTRWRCRALSANIGQIAPLEHLALRVEEALPPRAARARPTAFGRYPLPRTTHAVGRRRRLAFLMQPARVSSCLPIPARFWIGYWCWTPRTRVFLLRGCHLFRRPNRQERALRRPR
jgi:hypothetical protein